MIYGYCRTSRKQQNIERQIRNIKKAYPDAVIVTEKGVTGTTMKRPEWSKLYHTLEEGDTVVFDDVSRLARNCETGLTLYKELCNRGVGIVFLKQPQINSDVFLRSVDIMEYQVKLAFEQAEKEVTDLHQRTKEGIETARLNGKQIGRKEGSKIETKKAKEAKQTIKDYSKDFGGYLKDTEVMKMLNVSRNSYYKYKAELKAAKVAT